MYSPLYVHFLRRSTAVTYPVSRRTAARPINLSKATKLQDVVFVCALDPEWIATSLGTIPRDHQGLQQITINPSDVFYYSSPGPAGFTDIRNVIGETLRRGWLELDRVLSLLRESHRIQIRVLYNIPSMVDQARARGYMEDLLPEVTTGGTVELVEWCGW